MTRLRIPSIKLDLPTYHGTSDETLLKGLGHLEGTSLPVGGDDTHSVITGHRGLADATMFTHLDKVTKGDMFTLTTFGEVIAYQVVRTQVVEPDETESLQPVIGKDTRHSGHLHPSGDQLTAHPHHRRTRAPDSGRRPRSRHRRTRPSGLSVVDRHHGGRASRCEYLCAVVGATGESQTRESHLGERSTALIRPASRSLSISMGMSRRRSAPNFARACSTCDSTVRTDSTSRWLICTLVSPSATRRQTSSSRSVSVTAGEVSVDVADASFVGRGLQELSKL